MLTMADILQAQAQERPGAGAPETGFSWADVVGMAPKLPFPANYGLPMINSAISAVMLPGDVYSGKTEADLTNPEYRSRAFDLASLGVGAGPGSGGSVGSGAAYRQGFTERMAAGKEAASTPKSVYATARAPVVDEAAQPLLAPGETRGDMVRALGGEPAEESLGDLIRRAYRSVLEQPPPKSIAAVGKQAYDDTLTGFTLGSGSKKAAPVIAAPNIRNQNAPLFDYRNLAEVPDVPQFDLPRIVPARGIPEDILKSLDPENIKRVNAIVRQGLKKGGMEWYNTMPFKEAYQEELGVRKGTPAFEGLINAIGASSPDMKISPNIRTGSYYDWLLRNDEPLPKRIIKPSTGNWYVPEGEIPNPYGSRAQALHVQNMEALRDTGTLPVLDNPKPPSFIQNLLGNYRPVAVDRHNLSLFGVDRSAPGPGYQPLEAAQQAQAKKLGVAPAQYQAGGWLDYGSSGNEPVLKIIEDRIRATAEERGLTPAQVLKQLIRGQAPLR